MLHPNSGLTYLEDTDRTVKKKGITCCAITTGGKRFIQISE